MTTPKNTPPAAVYSAQLGWAVGLDLRSHDPRAGVIYLTYGETREEAEVLAAYVNRLLEPGSFESETGRHLVDAYLRAHREIR